MSTQPAIPSNQAKPTFKKHRYPRWFLERLKQRTGKKRWEVVSDFEDTGKKAGWLDHHGTDVVDGREVLVSRPYHLHSETRASLAQFCDRFDLQCDVQEGGPYGFRIIISPKDDW